MPWRVFSEIQTSQMIDRTQPSGDVVKCIPISWLDDNFAYLKNRIYIGSGSPVGVIYPEQDKAWYFDMNNNYKLYFWDGSQWSPVSIHRALSAQTAQNASQADYASVSDKLDGYDSSVDAVANTVAIRDSQGNLKASAFVSTAQSPTPPLRVSSSAVVSGLNADLVDGYHADQFVQRDENGDISTRRFISTAPEGIPPLQVSSTTQVTNLNADLLDGYDTTTTPAPNKIPVTDSNGKLNAFVDGAFATAVDLTNATEDYFLQVGEVAKINFSDTTSKPLRIATQSGTAYLLWINPSNTGGTSGANWGEIALLPNNTSYADAFVRARMARSSEGFSSSYDTRSYFDIGANFSHSFTLLLNFTAIKSCINIRNRYGQSTEWPYLEISASNWRDTSTPWTSLGTITWAQDSSGVILVQRIM